ncbi:MAG: hypothetical protein II972_05965, partial [Elusimicrobiaceae bacterium]|nr:hypothetical protein [Elusimicrobiaceae bacterium]
NKLEDKSFMTQLEQEHILSRANALMQDSSDTQKEAVENTSKETSATIITLNEEPEELLYKIYSSKFITPELTDNILWRYSIKEPFETLKDYQTNGSIMLIIVALVLYGLIAYIIDVFAYKEEKWTLI